MFNWINSLNWTTLLKENKTICWKWSNSKTVTIWTSEGIYQGRLDKNSMLQMSTAKVGLFFFGRTKIGSPSWIHHHPDICYWSRTAPPSSPDPCTPVEEAPVHPCGICNIAYHTSWVLSASPTPTTRNRIIPGVSFLKNMFESDQYYKNINF
jgi:hypothetical protein